jgi:hypothetical protein
MRIFRHSSQISRSLALLAAAVLVTGLVGGLLSGCTGAATPFAKKEANHSVTKIQPIDPTQPQSGTVRFFGYVDVTRDREDADQEFEARFGQFDQPVPASVVVTAFAPPLPDTCETSDRQNPIEIRDELAFPNHPYKFVSAGTEVLILYNGRRYAGLEPRPETDKANRREMITYESNVDSLRATFAGFKLFDARVRVDNLSVRIPGDGFPAFGPVSIPSVQEVSGFSLDATDRVIANTEFSWRRGDNPNAIVELSAGGGGRAVFCAAKDDGQFGLPEKIKQWLGANSIPNPEAHRESVAIYRQGEVILIVSQSTDL